MPNTLIEGMAAGMPIASSNRGPMPEVLGDAGVYFEPESVNSIVQALEGLLLSNVKRAELARKAVMKSQNFNWQTCALETWTFIVYTFETYKISGKKTMRNYAICAKCIMDTSAPNISHSTPKTYAIIAQIMRSISYQLGVQI